MLFQKVSDNMSDKKELMSNSLPIELFSVDPEYERETMRKVVHENADIIFLASIVNNHRLKSVAFSKQSIH